MTDKARAFGNTIAIRNRSYFASRQRFESVLRHEQVHVWQVRFKSAGHAVRSLIEKGKYGQNKLYHPKNKYGTAEGEAEAVEHGNSNPWFL